MGTYMRYATQHHSRPMGCHKNRRKVRQVTNSQGRTHELIETLKTAHTRQAAIQRSVDVERPNRLAQRIQELRKLDDEVTAAFRARTHELQ